MEATLRDLLMSTHGLVSYGLVFGVLIACGLGIPLPEDVSLITGGFLVHQHAAHLPVMMAVGFIGILGGDSLIYFFGRRFGTRVGTGGGGFFARIVTPEKRARVEKLFHQHGQKIVMIARFLPGLRAVTYFTAGSARMRYRWFILYDGLAALISAPLFVFLGYYFGDNLETVIGAVRRGQVKVIAGIAVLIVGYFVWTRIRKRRELAQAAADAKAAQGSEPPIKPPSAELTTPRA